MVNVYSYFCWENAGKLFFCTQPEWNFPKRELSFSKTFFFRFHVTFRGSIVYMFAESRTKKSPDPCLSLGFDFHMIQFLPSLQHPTTKLKTNSKRQLKNMPKPNPFSGTIFRCNLDGFVSGSGPKQLAKLPTCCRVAPLGSLAGRIAWRNSTGLEADRPLQFVGRTNKLPQTDSGILCPSSLEGKKKLFPHMARGATSWGGNCCEEANACQGSPRR